MKRIIMPLITLVLVAWSFSTVHAQIDSSQPLIIQAIDHAIIMGEIINDPEASEDVVNQAVELLERVDVLINEYIDAFFNDPNVGGGVFPGHDLPDNSSHGNVGKLEWRSYSPFTFGLQRA